MQLKEQAEIVIVINASDIEKNKIRGDLGITYDLDVLRLIDAFRGIGLYVAAVVLAQLCGTSRQPMHSSTAGALGVRVFRHYTIEGYPSNIPLIVSEQGYGRNEFIETSARLWW